MDELEVLDRFARTHLSTEAELAVYLTLDHRRPGFLSADEVAQIAGYPVAEIEPAVARSKKYFGNDLFADRRPQLYGLITEKFENTPLARVFDEPVRPNEAVRQIAAVQVSAPGAPEDILAAALAEVREAQFKHYADLLVFAEHFLFDRDWIAGNVEKAASFSARALAELTALAAELKVWLLPHLVERDGARYYSTVYLLSPEGVQGKYRATHLWDREREWATPGDDLPVFRAPFGNVGVMVGYEGMMPEVARSLALGGADLVAWPTAWRSPAEYQYVAHERAMENRVVIVAANRQDSPAPGPSLLIQPAGYPQNTLASDLAHGVRGFVTRFVALCACRVKRETNNTDLLLHRRPELYGNITGERHEHSHRETRSRRLA